MASPITQQERKRVKELIDGLFKEAAELRNIPKAKKTMEQFPGEIYQIIYDRKRFAMVMNYLFKSVRSNADLFFPEGTPGVVIANIIMNIIEEGKGIPQDEEERDIWESIGLSHILRLMKDDLREDTSTWCRFGLYAAMGYGAINLPQNRFRLIEMGKKLTQRDITKLATGQGYAHPILPDRFLTIPEACGFQKRDRYEIKRRKRETG